MSYKSAALNVPLGGCGNLNISPSAGISSSLRGVAQPGLLAVCEGEWSEREWSEP